MKPPPGDDPPVGEPEIEEVPVDEATIPEGGDGIEKREEGALDLGRGRAEVCVRDNDQLVTKHEPKIPDWRCALQALAPFDFPLACDETSPMTNATDITVRVNYSETDRMGVAYHARHVVWLDMARTEYLRTRGMRYRDIEDMGYRLVVAELKVRYLKPAGYDDLVRIRCWVRDLGSRRVLFAYAIENADTDTLLAKAETNMVCLNQDMSPTRMPATVMAALSAAPSPVPL